MNKLAAGIAVAAVLAVAGAWVALGESSELALDTSTCKPKGWLAELRSQIQESRFDRDQLEAINKKIASVSKNIDKFTDPKVDQFLEQFDQRMDKVTNDFYAKHPNAAPSPAQQQAEALRRAADKLESQEERKQIIKTLVSYREQLVLCAKVLSDPRVK